MAQLINKRKSCTNGAQAQSKRAKAASLGTETRQNCIFLNLPAEVRNEIYELALLDDKDEPIRLRSTNVFEERTKFNLWREPALLQVCRTIREEASALYYCSHAFELSCRTYVPLNMAVDWIRGVVVRCGNNPFKYMTIQIDIPLSEQLEDLCPLVQLFYETDLQLNAPPASTNESENPNSLGGDTSTSLFRFNRLPFRIQHMYVTLLEQAVALGKKARREGWQEDSLDVEFGLLVYGKRCEEQAEAFASWLEKRREMRKS